MTGETAFTKKLFLRLSSSGHIALDTDYMWDGCDTPEIDPEIDLKPVPLQKLAQLLSSLYLDTAEKEDVERLKVVLTEIKTSGEIIKAAIKEIEARFP